MDLGIRGRVAVVAGSSQGLGRAIADALAAEGVDLVINSRSPDKLLEVKAEIEEAFGVRVEAVPCDLTPPDGASDLISAAERAFDKVDILVTNTGGPPAGMFEDHSVEVWDDAIADVLFDAFPGNLQDQIRTQLSSSIIGIVAQTLLPRIGGGRCAAYEILVVTSGVANLIRENKTFRINSAIQTGAKHGMQLMDDALFGLWKEEKCTIEDVLGKSQNPDDLAKRIVNAKRGMEEEENESVPDVFRQ